MQLHRHKALNINAGEFSRLIEVGLVAIKKDKVLTKGKEKIRLLVAQLISPLHKRAFVWNEYESGAVHIEIERHLRTYVDQNVARALRSRLGDMIRNRALVA